MSADHLAPSTRGPARPVGLAPWFTDALLVLAVVVAGASLGIALRPAGLLSAFWPANAILLGLFIRWPRLASLLGWGVALAAFVATDVATGSTWTRALILTGINLAGVVTAFSLLHRSLDSDHRAPRESPSIVRLSLAVAAGAVAVAIAGALAHPVLFKGPPSIRTFTFWGATELTNYMVILPVMLTTTAFWRTERWRNGLSTLRAQPQFAAPLMAYALTLAVVPVIGGPGALAFPIPSLLWCALVYGLATTAWLNLSFAVWALLVVGANATAFGLELDTPTEVLSLRIGVMLGALGPLTVASVMSARAELLREARRARKSAEDAMAARALLLATMAHELRSPLTSVVGFSSMMARQAFGPLGNPKYLDYAQSIELAGSHLSDLVTDLLDTAKIEAGQIELAPARASSRDITEQSLRLVRGLALEAQVTVTVEAGTWPDVWADPRAVKQVLINLLSNAIKFSDPDSAVTVSSVVEGDALAICVTDQGCGIAPQDLADLGRAYAQAGDPETRRQGTGLGLAFSRDLVQRHGGRLRIESAIGAGTSVTFDLPLAERATI
jgi:signal transduction histidine kinase